MCRAQVIHTQKSSLLPNHGTHMHKGQLSRLQNQVVLIEERRLTNPIAHVTTASNTTSERTSQKRKLICNETHRQMPKQRH